MSFKYKGIVVTLGNYSEVFNGLDVDILDEIRSAILDDTPISGLIKYCLSDAYKLGQLRMAIREFIPKDFINPRLSGKAMFYIRKLYSRNSDIEVLRKYIPKTGAPTIQNDSLELILKSMLLGANIRKVDFNTVPNSNIEIICEGLIKGYPMWLCTDTDKPLEVCVIRQLMKGMKLGIDVHPFLSGDWSESQIITLLANSSKVNIGNILQFINYKFSVDQIMEIIYACRDKLDFDLLCVTDSDNNPLFNSYQMNVLSMCLRDDVLTDKIYNPKLSDMEMLDLFNIELSAKKALEGKKLSGSLKKST